MRKKLSLREFQEYLATRLTSAARGETSLALLGVRSGQQSWLLNLADSGEIIPAPKLAPVPLTQPWFSGIANIRGNLYSVVDFSAFRGGEPTPLNSAARLVLIGTRFGVNSAILVNRMLGLKPASDFRSAAAKGPLPDWIDACAEDSAGQLWHRLNVAALLADPTFMQVGQ